LYKGNLRINTRYRYHRSRRTSQKPENTT
jgi:hypothetical protein